MVKLTQDIVLYRAVFCDAFKKGLYGDKIQWLIVGMYEDQWWNTLERGVDCSPIQVNNFEVKRNYVMSILTSRDMCFRF